MIISNEDIKTLSTCKSKLENVGLIMQGVNFVGSGIEKGMKFIPDKTQRWIGKKTNTILMSLVSTNLKTFKKGKTDIRPSNKTYKFTVFASGAGLGFFGPAGFAADLALSTKFMMRSIMDIARSKGEDLSEIETQLACVEVFALGGSSKNDDGIETGYYASKLALKNAIKEASEYVTANVTIDVIEKLVASNAFLGFIAKVAERFSIQVTEKFVADAVPVVGALSGGSINLIFIHHFQKMADAHFTIRQLERKYGEEVIRDKYNEIRVN
jgi:hypothetical protein